MAMLKPWPSTPIMLETGTSQSSIITALTTVSDQAKTIDEDILAVEGEQS